jgi:hypothetical protein
MNSNWIYEVSCSSCGGSYEGKELDCHKWLTESCQSRLDKARSNHSGVVTAQYYGGQCKCSSCKRSYVRIKGGSATEDLCEICVDQGKAPKKSKMASSRSLACGVEVSFSSRTLFGKNYSHVRKDYIFGGEDWACSGTQSTYDTLSGHDSYPCGKKATVHLALEGGNQFQNGSDFSDCAIFCVSCAKRWLKLSGVRTLPLG